MPDPVPSTDLPPRSSSLAATQEVAVPTEMEQKALEGEATGKSIPTPAGNQTTADAELLLNLGSAVDSGPSSPIAVRPPAAADTDVKLAVDAEDAVSTAPFLHTPPDDLDPRPTPSSSDLPLARSSTPAPPSPGPPPGSAKKRKLAEAGSSRFSASGEARPLPPHHMGEDNVIIRCICGFKEDDGFTIQCEGCYAWQHGQCFGYTDEASAPEIYFCELCEPREVDVHAAVRVQLESRREFQLARLAAEERDADGKEARGKPRGKKRQRTASVMEDDAEEKDGSIAGSAAGASGAGGSGTGIMGPPSMKPKRKQPGPKPKPKTTPVTTPISEIAPSIASIARQKSIPPIEVEDDYFRIEPWTFEYTPIKENIVRGRPAKQAMAELYRTWVDEEDVPEEKRPYRTASGLPSPTETGIIRLSPDRNMAAPNFSILGAPVPPVLIKAPDLASIAALVSVRTVSGSSSFLPLSYNEPPTSSILFTGPPIYAVYAGMRLGEGSFVGELAGEVLDCKTYRRNPINQYAELGLPKPFVHALGPPVDIVLDSRAYGSDLRFIRSGCHPNAVLRPVLHKTGESSATSVKFGVFTSCDVSKGDELVLGWEWDDQHVVHALKQLIMSFHPSCPSELVIPDAGIARLLDKFEQVLTALLGSFSTCACIDPAGCSIEQMRSLVKTGDVLRPGHGSVAPGSHRKGLVTSPAVISNKLDLGGLVGAVRGWRKTELEVERYRQWKKEERLGLGLNFGLKREPDVDGDTADVDMDGSTGRRRHSIFTPSMVPSPALSNAASQLFEDVSIIDIPPPMDRRMSEFRSVESMTDRAPLSTPRKSKSAASTAERDRLQPGQPRRENEMDVDLPEDSTPAASASKAAEEGEPEIDVLGNDTDEDVEEDARSDATSDTEPRSHFTDSEGEWDQPAAPVSGSQSVRRGATGSGRKKRSVLSPVAEVPQRADGDDVRDGGQEEAETDIKPSIKGRKSTVGARGREVSTVSANTPTIPTRSGKKGKKNRIVSSPPEERESELASPAPEAADAATVTRDAAHEPEVAPELEPEPFSSPIVNVRKPSGKQASGRKNRVVSSPVDSMDSPVSPAPSSARRKGKVQRPNFSPNDDERRKDVGKDDEDKRARVPDQAVSNMFEPEELVPSSAAIEGVVPSEEAKMDLDTASPTPAEERGQVDQAEPEPEQEQETEPKEPTPPPEPPKKVSLSEYLKNHKFRKESVPSPINAAIPAVAGSDSGFAPPVDPSPATEAVQAGLALNASSAPPAGDAKVSPAGIKAEPDVSAAPSQSAGSQGGRFNLSDFLPSSARTPATLPVNAGTAPAPYAPLPVTTPGSYSAYSATPTPGHVTTPTPGVAGSAAYVPRNEYFPPQPQAQATNTGAGASAYVPRQASASYVPRQASMGLTSSTPTTSEMPPMPGPGSGIGSTAVPPSNAGFAVQGSSAPSLGPTGPGAGAYVPRPSVNTAPSSAGLATFEQSPSHSLPPLPHAGFPLTSPSPSIGMRALPEPTPSPTTSSLPPPPPGLPRAPPTGPRVPPTGPRGSWPATGPRPAGLPLNPLAAAGPGSASTSSGGPGEPGTSSPTGTNLSGAQNVQGAAQGMRPPVPSPGPGLGYTARGGGGGFRGGFRGGMGGMGRGTFGLRGRGGFGRGM